MLYSSSAASVIAEKSDQLVRSNKKVKIYDGEEEGLLGNGSRVAYPVSISNEQRCKICFRNTVMGDAIMSNACQHEVELGVSIEGYNLSNDESEGELGEEDALECPTIYVTKAEKVSLREPWHHMLIIKFLGQLINFNFLKRRLKQIQGLKIPVTMIDLVNDFFMIRFDNIQEYNHVLHGGPCMVADHYLHVQ